jgi:hypothetical protein
MDGTFTPGDHLQVRRPLGYYHHGIYVSDDRVIQFGSGITMLNKGGTAIDAVTLADFEQGGPAKVVRHGYESWFTGHHPATDEGWKIVARAEFLLKLQPRLKYNLIGHNYNNYYEWVEKGTSSCLTLNSNGGIDIVTCRGATSQQWLLTDPIPNENETWGRVVNDYLQPNHCYDLKDPGADFKLGFNDYCGGNPPQNDGWFLYYVGK